MPLLVVFVVNVTVDFFCRELVPHAKSLASSGKVYSWKQFWKFENPRSMHFFTLRDISQNGFELFETRMVLNSGRRLQGPLKDRFCDRIPLGLTRGFLIY